MCGCALQRSPCKSPCCILLGKRSHVQGVCFLLTGLAYVVACICGSSCAALAAVVSANVLAARHIPHRLREVLMYCRCMSFIDIQSICSEAFWCSFMPQAVIRCLLGLCRLSFICP